MMSTIAASTTYLPIGVQKDTQLTKIFVGGLPYSTTDKSLREYFEPFGDIEEAVVITDRQTGKSRGYGFVTMSDQGAAELACKEPNPTIDGRKANVNLAYLGAKPRQNALASSILPYVMNLKSSSGAQYGYSAQYVYPAASYSYLTAATPTATTSLTPTSLSLSPTPGSTGQYALDYTSAAAYSAAYTAQMATSAYKAAYSPYTGLQAGSLSPTTADGFPSYHGYTYLPQQQTAGAGTMMSAAGSLPTMPHQLQPQFQQMTSQFQSPPMASQFQSSPMTSQFPPAFQAQQALPAQGQIGQSADPQSMLQ